MDKCGATVESKTVVRSSTKYKMPPCTKKLYPVHLRTTCAATEGMSCRSVLTTGVKHGLHRAHCVD